MKKVKRRGDVQPEFDTTADVFNLHVQHADDPLRVEMDRLRAARAREDARAYEVKMQTTLEECPGFQGVEGLTGPDAIGTLMIDPRQVAEAMPWLKRRFHVDENLELSHSFGLCVEIQARGPRKVGVRRKPVFGKPVQYEFALG